MRHKLLACLFSLVSIFAFSQNSDLTVNVNGLKSDKGKCLLSLYSNKIGFTGSVDKAFKTDGSTISNGKATIVLKNIREGEYAISVDHDENGNGKMDTNFVGMPKEGVGVSNNAKSSFGPPSFED
jgi:uncharacterized protein (DUF2141 family)